MPRVHLYEAKHLMFVQPILLIALAGARLSFRVPGMERRNYTLLIVVLGFAALNAIGLRDYFRPGFEKENWRRLATDVSRARGRERLDPVQSRLYRLRIRLLRAAAGRPAD